MATPKTPVPASPPSSTSAGITADSIAKSGESLTRLLVAALTLPLTVFNAVGTGLTNTIKGVTAALDGTPASQNSSEIGRATGDLINATTGLFQSLINAATQSLEAATRAINAAAQETNNPPRK